MKPDQMRDNTVEVTTIPTPFKGVTFGKYGAPQANHPDNYPKGFLEYEARFVREQMKEYERSTTEHNRTQVLKQRGLAWVQFMKEVK